MTGVTGNGKLSGMTGEPHELPSSNLEQLLRDLRADSAADGLRPLTEYVSRAPEHVEEIALAAALAAALVAAEAAGIGTIANAQLAA